MMACNGVVKQIPPGLIVPESMKDYIEAEDYFEQREYGHFVCINIPAKCSIKP